MAFCLSIFAFVALSNAQWNDAQWMLGPNTTNIDFRSSTPVSDSIQKWMGTYITNAAISDDGGELLYYTNGIYIAGKLSGGDSLLNGNNLNPCSFTTANTSGLPILQASLFLKKPDSDRYFYLIHFSGDTNNGTPFTLMYSTIDKEANFGLGAVISKNDTVYQTIFRRGGLAACKHANGRDWWIVLATRQTNQFNVFLLTPNGITDTLKQNIGPVYLGPFDNCYSRFSLDGTKYVTGTYVGLISVLDFDRCTGVFSKPRTISNIAAGFNSEGISSVEFSPNGRFVYASTSVDVKQYDLNNPNIQDSVVLFNQTGSQHAGISQLSLACDGRIYGSTWDAGYNFLHVINSPDRLGLNCNFVYGGQPTLSFYSSNLSNTANPRLGALTSSGCDTITTTQITETEKQQVRIQPNPANKYVYVEMPMQGNYIFELLNEAGQLIEQKQTRQVDIFNTENLPSGIYYLKVTSSKTSSLVSSQKVIVQH